MKIAMTMLGAVTMLGGCAMNGDMASGSDAGGKSASAGVNAADGKDHGRVTATETAEGVRVSYEGKALPPGQHGVHVHMTGKCEAPAFESAGPHWNPTAKMHGSMNPMGPHAGDLPNLSVAADGRATIAFTVPGATLSTGPEAMLDADGAAFVVHAAVDDLKTDPSGNSGARIACGVFG